MDSQVVQELLPGTGSLGSVPMQHVRAIGPFLLASSLTPPLEL